MQYSKKYSIISGFTLIESMLGIMTIGLVSGSIMLGITTFEEKLFEIRLKEHAFEELQNYEILVHRYVYNKSLKIELGLNHIIWKNSGFDPFYPESNPVKDIQKTSFVLGFSYNFDYPGRNRGLE